jgi:hypothetical protein
VVVVREPVWQRGGSGGWGAVALAVGPFVGQGLLVALDIATRLMDHFELASLSSDPMVMYSAA